MRRERREVDLDARRRSFRGDESGAVEEPGEEAVVTLGLDRPGVGDAPPAPEIEDQWEPRGGHLLPAQWAVRDGLDIPLVLADECAEAWIGRAEEELPPYELGFVPQNAGHHVHGHRLDSDERRLEGRDRAVDVRLASSASSRPRGGSRRGRPRSSRSSRPRRSPAPHASIASVVSSSSKRNRTWFSTTSFRTSQPGSSAIAAANCVRRRSSARRGRRRPSARASAAPRRPRSRARAARTRASSPSASRAAPLARDEVLGREPHRRAVRVGVRDEREPAVVRDVQPLVRVGRPRVGALDAARRGGASSATPPPTARTRRRRAARRPAVPRSVRDLAERIERRRCSPRRPARRRSSARARPRAPPRARPAASGPASSTSTRRIAAAAEPEEPQRAVDRHVLAAPDDDADRRRAGEPVALDVPADAPEHVVPRRGEAR